MEWDEPALARLSEVSAQAPSIGKGCLVVVWIPIVVMVALALFVAYLLMH